MWLRERVPVDDTREKEKKRAVLLVARGVGDGSFKRAADNEDENLSRPLGFVAGGCEGTEGGISYHQGGANVSCRAQSGFRCEIVRREPASSGGSE